MGVSADAKISFSNDVKKNGEMSNQNIQILFQGTERNTNDYEINVDSTKDLIEGFYDDYKEGVPTHLTLVPLSTLPDY